MLHSDIDRIKVNISSINKLFNKNWKYNRHIEQHELLSYCYLSTYTDMRNNSYDKVLYGFRKDEDKQYIQDTCKQLDDTTQKTIWIKGIQYYHIENKLREVHSYRIKDIGKNIRCIVSRDNMTIELLRNKENKKKLYTLLRQVIEKLIYMNIIEYHYRTVHRSKKNIQAKAYRILKSESITVSEAELATDIINTRALSIYNTLRHNKQLIEVGTTTLYWNNSYLESKRIMWRYYNKTIQQASNRENRSTDMYRYEIVLGRNYIKQFDDIKLLKAKRETLIETLYSKADIAIRQLVGNGAYTEIRKLLLEYSNMKTGIDKRNIVSKAKELFIYSNITY